MAELWATFLNKAGAKAIPKATSSVPPPPPPPAKGRTR